MRRVLAMVTVFIFILGGGAFGQEATEVNMSMAQALKASGVEEMASLGIDGTGIRVAVIDTGIDVGHHDLQQTPAGKPKIIDFMDFTDEGLVETEPVPDLGGDQLAVRGREYGIKGIASKSGEFRWGILREEQLDEQGPLMQDLNRNGKNNDEFAVLVVDSTLPGIYDTVYVDTKLNLDFSDEKALKMYGKGLDWDSFNWESPRWGQMPGSSFAVTHIERDGSKVKISFDGHGHGTHVAGILGASGKMAGVAPAAEVIAIKAMASSGAGRLEDIALAVEYAKSQGADIINISLGGLTSSYKEHLSLLNLLTRVAQDRETLIVMAAGNHGPGLSTATDVAGNKSVVVVGAYASADLWDTNYGVKVPGETLLHDSGVGPNTNGGLAPDLLAPSMFRSTVPLWDMGGYSTMDGTSMAASFASGVSALLMERAKTHDIGTTAPAIKEALIKSARSIEGYNLLEQGHGLINAKEAWKALEGASSDRPGEGLGVQLSKKEGYIQGTLYKDELWGNETLSLTNFSNNLQDLQVKSDTPWALIGTPRLLLPRGKSASLNLIYNFPTNPGLYFANITGSPQVFEGSELDFLTTVVVPHNIHDEGALYWRGSLGPSRLKRYFFRVNPGITAMTVDLSILQDEGSGRGLLYLYDPQGRTVLEDYAGADFFMPRPYVKHQVHNPTAGVWEAVLVSDYNLSHFGANKTNYELGVAPSGLTIGGDHISLGIRKNLSSFSRRIKLSNSGKDFKGVLATSGLADTQKPYKTSNVVVKDGVFTPGPTILVGQEALELEINLGESKGPLGDIDLYLYRKDPRTQEYHEVDSRVIRDTNQEKIHIIKPEPGEYRVYLDGFSLPQGDTQVPVNWRVISGSQGFYIKNPPTFVKGGETVELDLYGEVPETGSDFLAYISLVEEENKATSHIPVRIYVGKEELDISISPDTITVTSQETGDLVDTVVKVNGILYKTRRGTVKLPANLKIEKIEINDTNYAPLFWES